MTGNNREVDAGAVIQALQQQIADAMLQCAVKDAQIAGLRNEIEALQAPPGQPND